MREVPKVLLSFFLTTNRFHFNTTNMVEIQMILINEYGEFKGRKTILSVEDYNTFLTMCKNFHSAGGFDLTCEDGTFMVFAPQIVQKSILKINNIIIEQNV